MGILVAPIIEEFYKILTVRLTGTTLPAWGFALLEFVSYVRKQVGFLTFGGIPGAIAFLLFALARWQVVRMHLATSRLYLQDYERQGFISGTTMLRGMTIHALWNLGASLLGVVFSFVQYLPAELIWSTLLTKIGANQVVRYVAGYMKRNPVVRAEAPDAVSAAAPVAAPALA
jgi:hypothetical protein